MTMDKGRSQHFVEGTSVMATGVDRGQM